MSKITKALEKAARDRLLHRQEQATVAATKATLALAPVNLADIVSAGNVTVDPHIVSATDPKSPIAEQYRILRTNLQTLRMRPGAKTIVVTSAIHGEGKSVTAINLALTLARQENLKVVLIDGDLRKGSIRRWMGLPDTHEGLSTVLQRGGEVNGHPLTLPKPPPTLL